MGLSLIFMCGDESKIIESAKAMDFDSLEKNIKLKADFSLHLFPQDLDTLSIAAAKFNKLREEDLRSHMKVIIDEVDHGLLMVDFNWVDYIRKVPETSTEGLVKEWFGIMQKQYKNEIIQVSDESIKAVKDLIGLGVYASQNKKELLHFWYL